MLVSSWITAQSSSSCIKWLSTKSLLCRLVNPAGGSSASLVGSTSFSSLCTVLAPVTFRPCMSAFTWLLVGLLTSCFLWLQTFCIVNFQTTILIISCRGSAMHGWQSCPHTYSRRCFREHAVKYFALEWVLSATILDCCCSSHLFLHLDWRYPSLHPARRHSVTNMCGCACLGLSGPWGAWEHWIQALIQASSNLRSRCLQH